MIIPVSFFYRLLRFTHNAFFSGHLGPDSWMDSG